MSSIALGTAIGLDNYCWEVYHEPNTDSMWNNGSESIATSVVMPIHHARLKRIFAFGKLWRMFACVFCMFRVVPERASPPLGEPMYLPLPRTASLLLAKRHYQVELNCLCMMDEPWGLELLALPAQSCLRWTVRQALPNTSNCGCGCNLAQPHQ